MKALRVGLTYSAQRRWPLTGLGHWFGVDRVVYAPGYGLRVRLWRFTFAVAWSPRAVGAAA